MYTSAQTSRQDRIGTRTFEPHIFRGIFNIFFFRLGTKKKNWGGGEFRSNLRPWYVFLCDFIDFYC
jgi:hypothetical protein